MINSKTALLIIILSFLFPVFADNIAEKVENLINETDSNINIGFRIRNLDKNNIIHEKNVNRYFTFASGLKFITLTTLLEELGGDYKFDSAISKIGNDYYLDIHDPEFTTDDLDVLVSSLKSKNISSIKGNFYIINKEFLLPPLIRTKTVSDTVYCNTGPITRLHINKNCAKVNVLPTEIGQKVEVSDTQLVPYKIENKLVTTSDSNIDLIYTSIDTNKYIISGTLNKSTKLLTIGAVTNDNLNNVRLVLKLLLQKHGINLKGKILPSIPVKTSEVIAMKKNHFFAIASQAMKKSDNFVTDYLLAEASSTSKEMINEIGDRQMEWRDAARLLKKLVQKHTGVDITDSLIEDGSGISRVNVLTVSQIDEILQVIAKKPNFPEILSMLATPGEEGTLKNRYSKDLKLYAKTGRLTGVVSLLGYFYNTKGELHSFVIVINNIYGDTNKYIKLEDSILGLFQTGLRK